MASNFIEVDSDEKSIEINGKIKFLLEDEELGQVLALLNRSGRLLLDCPNCGTTVIPQARSLFNSTGNHELKVSCVHCGKNVLVRMYPNYGFVVDLVD